SLGPACRDYRANSAEYIYYSPATAWSVPSCVSGLEAFGISHFRAFAGGVDGTGWRYVWRNEPYSALSAASIQRISGACCSTGSTAWNHAGCDVAGCSQSVRSCWATAVDICWHGASCRKLLLNVFTRS